MLARPVAAARRTSIVLLLLSFSVDLAPRVRSEEPQRPAPQALDRVGAAELLWNSGHGLVPLPVVDVEVDLAVTGIVVHGRVAQRFQNPTDEVIEALFVFPLPDRAAVQHMEMRIGDRRIVSTIREKEQARREYDHARETGRKASLVDQARPNLFTTSVANINPGEAVAVVLDYYEEIDYEDGRFGLRFPLTFTPRFAPSGAEPPADRGAEEAAAATPVYPSARVRVSLDPGFPLARVDSGSHAIRFEAAGDELRIVTAPESVLADRDFLLEWVPRRGSQPRSAAFVEQRGAESYALVLVLPPAPDGELGLGLPTETLFVVDVSGSMSGPSIEQARAALLAALDRLRPEDRFGIVAFSDEQRTFRPAPVQADAAALAAARDWVSGLTAGGGTMIEPALLHGLAMMGQSRSGHAQRIVFLTDGAVANEQELLRALSERLGEVRLHAIGIGHAPNTYLMRKMARIGRGSCLFVSDVARAPRRMAEFLARLDRPVVEDVVLDASAAGLEQIEPVVLPDLYAGAPLVLSARLTDSGSRRTLRIGGYARTGRSDFSVDLPAAAPEGAGVALRWARQRIESLMDGLYEGADPGAVREEVVRLALDFHLVTAYTSLVAVEDAPTALGEARPVPLAVALPAGGSDNPLKRVLGLALVGCGLLALAGLRRLGSR